MSVRSNCQQNGVKIYAYILIRENPADLVNEITALPNQVTAEPNSYLQRRITAQSRTGSQRSLKITRSFRNRQFEMLSNLTANRSCVPVASWDAYWSPADMHFSTSGAQESLTKSLMRCRGLRTSFGHPESMRCMAAAATKTSTIAFWPSIRQNRPPCSTESDDCGRCTINAESIQLFY